MKKCLHLFMICLCTGFISCSDDNDNNSIKAYVPETYNENFLNLENVKWAKTDKVEIGIGQVGLLKIEGGSGDYTLQSGDEEIAEILKHPSGTNVYTITNEDKLGSTNVTIKDKDGNLLAIPVTFGKRTTTFALCNSNLDIIIKEGQNDVEEVVVKDITQKIKERNILKGTALELTYDKSDSGKIEIKNSKNEVTNSGVFEESKDNKYTYLDITINEKEYRYILTKDYSGLLKSIGPETIYFIEDLTQLFQTDYPKITNVLALTTVCL